MAVKRVKETQNLFAHRINCYKTKAVALLYHWRELPRVSFFVATKDLTGQNTSKYIKYLSPQTQFCRDKTFVATSLLLSRQTRVCRNKTRLFVVTKVCLPQQNTSFVVTKVCFSRQTRGCHDKYLSRQNYFVATNISLSRQNSTSIHLSWQANFSRDKGPILSNFCPDKNSTCGSSLQ